MLLSSGVRRTLPFRWILPFAELLVSAVLLWPIAPVIAAQLHRSPATNKRPDLAQKLHGQTWQIVIEPLSPMAKHDLHILEMRLWAPVALNFPGLFVNLPYAIFLSPSKSEWSPHMMDFRMWRAIQYPIICAPFWWIAGRAVEALSSLRKRVLRPVLRWPELLFSGGFIFTGISACVLAVSAHGDGEIPYSLVAVGGGIWLVLGAIGLMAFVQQKYLRKTDNARV